MGNDKKVKKAKKARKKEKSSDVSSTSQPSEESSILSNERLLTIVEDARVGDPNALLESRIQCRDHPVDSLQDLLKRCTLAVEQQWIAHEPLATVRSRLGWPLKKTDLDTEFGDELLPLFVDFLADVQQNQESSDYLRPLLESSSEEPNAAIFLLQFLHYIDQVSGHEDLMKLADLLAKDSTIGSWCREIIRYPDEFHPVLLDCCLAQLQKVTCIVDEEEKAEFIKSVILRGSKTRKGVTELRTELVNLVNREQGVGPLTISRALYFHNMIDSCLFGKNDELPVPPDFVNTFRTLLLSCRDQFPSPAHFDRVMMQLWPHCNAPGCYARAPISCCELSSYCSEACRERDWIEHREVCLRGVDSRTAVESIVEEKKAGDHDPWGAGDGKTEERPLFGENGFGTDFTAGLSATDATEEPSVTFEPTEEFDAKPWEDDHCIQLPLEQPEGTSEASQALAKQNALLVASPGIDYFILQPWGALGVLLQAKLGDRFRDLRSTAVHKPTNVAEMYEILAECVPSLKEVIEEQLEMEYQSTL